MCGIKASILHLQLWGLSHYLSVKTTQCQRPGRGPAPKRCRQIAGNNIYMASVTHGHSDYSNSSTEVTTTRNEITTKRFVRNTAGAMKRLPNALWKRRCISRQTKLRMHRALISSVLLYGSETWNLTIRDSNRLNAFGMSCLRRLENVKWYHHVRNSNIRQRNKQHPVSITLTQRRLRWFGHLQRMPPENEVLKLHNFSPGTIGWARPRGRPRRRWMDCVSQDLAVIDLPSLRQFVSPIIASPMRAVFRRVTSTLDDQQEL